MRRSLAARFVIVMLAITAIVTVATAQTPPGRLAVTGNVTTPLSITLAEFKALPRMKVEVKSEGRVTTYEGVLIGEILKRAGVPAFTQMRSDALISYAIATASDGYRAIFSLAELDSALTSNDIIVADTMDGKPLPDQQGPFRTVAPKDNRLSRSVRMLDHLEVVTLPK